MVIFVICLPFVLFAGVVAFISDLLIKSGQKSDAIAVNALGDAYTRPRNAFLKFLKVLLLILCILWIGSMALEAIGGSDCDFSGRGTHCS
jgi:uncharacterized membrane protein